MNNIKALLKFIGDTVRKLIGMKVGLDVETDKQVGLDVETDKQKEISEIRLTLRKCKDSEVAVIRCDFCGSRHFHQVGNPYY